MCLVYPTNIAIDKVLIPRPSSLFVLYNALMLVQFHNFKIFTSSSFTDINDLPYKLGTHFQLSNVVAQEKILLDVRSITLEISIQFCQSYIRQQCRVRGPTLFLLQLFFIKNIKDPVEGSEITKIHTEPLQKNAYKKSKKPETTTSGTTPTTIIQAAFSQNQKLSSENSLKSKNRNISLGQDMWESHYPSSVREYYSFPIQVSLQFSFIFPN